MSEVVISGIEDLVKKLAEGPAKVEKKLLGQALDQYANDLVSLLQISAPFDASHKSGYYSGGSFQPLPHLKFSLSPHKAADKQGYVRRSITANFYARFVEQGHNPAHSRIKFKERTGSRKGYDAYGVNKTSGFIQAEPFIRPTLEGAGEFLLQQFVDNIAQKIGAIIVND